MKDFLVALLPSVGVLLIFYIGIKALIEADRRERTAQARIEAAQDAAARADGASGDPSADNAAEGPSAAN